MSTKPKGFIEAKSALAQIVADAASHNGTVDQSVERIKVSHAQLSAMADKWKSAVVFITAQASAAPDDPVWKALKLETDKVVADFVAMRDRAKSIRDAALAAK